MINPNKNKIILKRDSFYKLLEKKGMSVVGLAHVMDVNPSTIYRMLNQEGETKSTMIAKMMAAFGLKENEFDVLFIFKSSLLKNNNAIPII
ncbi:helix-turn-helix domain-containing protein [Pediococcus pentosaceus]|uniref:helix-turn-helix domain-containing protein n=1 Tax=Pediococcus pentosaceus TaxID=1255 RepID=UPI0013213B4C|nr:helix-turn-helix transcriptional regulator [Pediococcus pentosaceus]KAF0444179.1 helix-turn-helix domain-containing protein [Pediococcus pentosaceus]